MGVTIRSVTPIFFKKKLEKIEVQGIFFYTGYEYYTRGVGLWDVR
jgi:hypothetical protein